MPYCHMKQSQHFIFRYFWQFHHFLQSYGVINGRSVKRWPDMTWPLDLTPLHNTDLRAGHDLLHQTIAPSLDSLLRSKHSNTYYAMKSGSNMPGSSASEYLIYSYKRVPWERLTASIRWHLPWKCLIFLHTFYLSLLLQSLYYNIYSSYYS